MTDTVTRLMGLVGEYTYNYAEDAKYGTFSVETTTARKALEAELIRLFTPLSDDAIAEAMMNVWGCSSIAPRQAPAFARAIEQLIKGTRP